MQMQKRLLDSTGSEGDGIVQHCGQYATVDNCSDASGALPCHSAGDPVQPAERCPPIYTAWRPIGWQIGPRYPDAHPHRVARGGSSTPRRSAPRHSAVCHSTVQHSVPEHLGTAQNAQAGNVNSALHRAVRSATPSTPRHTTPHYSTAQWIRQSHSRAMHYGTWE